MTVKIINLLYKIAAVVCAKLAFAAQCSNSIAEVEFKLLIIFFLFFIFVSAFCFWRFREQIWGQIKIYLMFNASMAKRVVAAVFKTGLILPFLFSLFFMAISLRFLNTIYTAIPSLFIFSFFMACLKESVFQEYVGKKILKRPIFLYASTFVISGSKAYDLPFVFMGLIHGVFIVSLYMQGMYIASGGLSCLTLGIFAMYSPLLNCLGWRHYIQSFFNPVDIYSLKRPAASLQEWWVLPQEVTWKSYCRYFLAFAAGVAVTWLIFKLGQPPQPPQPPQSSPSILTASSPVGLLGHQPVFAPLRAACAGRGLVMTVAAGSAADAIAVAGVAAEIMASRPPSESALLDIMRTENVSRDEAFHVFALLLEDRLESQRRNIPRV